MDAKSALEACRLELASLRVDPDNPYMQCLTPLFAPPSEEHLDHLISYYERLLGTVAGKQRDVVAASLAAFRQKKHFF
jgi:hypothetical protein